MRSTLAHHDPADLRPASSTRFAGASIHLVLQLKGPFLAVRIDIVGNGRAFEANGGGQNVEHRAVQTSGAILAQTG